MSRRAGQLRPTAGMPVRRPYDRKARPGREGASGARPLQGSWLVMAGYVLATAVLTGVYARNPTERHGLAAYLAICFGVAAAIAWGTRRYRPRVRTGWYLLGAAPPLGSVGMVLRGPLASAEGAVLPLVPDIITITAYLLLIAGLFSFLRARRGARADTAVDGGLMAVAALLLSWATLIEPVLANAQMPGGLKVVNGAYPTISVAILFLGALIAMTEVRGLLAFWALALSWVGLMTGDLVYALASVDTVTLPLWAANCAYCAFCAFLGAAGLHPSMVSLGRPAPKRVRGYGHTRFVAVAVALLVPAGVVGFGGKPVWAVLMAVLGALVLTRTTGAVNRHATSEVRLEKQANSDPLTGLPNRLRLTAHLEESLSRAHSSGRGVGVLFIDLDQFKTVNDSWGHETGDELLIVVARRLTGQLRNAELVARVGGDEFVIVCEHISSPDEAVGVGRRILAQLDTVVALGSANIPITSSVGVTFARPRDRDASVEDLLREADTAMYRAKAHGGASVVLFDESMRTEISERIALEGSLRGALNRGEMRLHYQPIVDLRTGVTTGFEALMRWQHPERGLVPPDGFIPVAEDTGLIVKLGRWAIEEATGQLAEWRRDVGRPLTMSVNLSPRQLRDPQLVPTVRAALTEHGLPGEALCLEVTETTLMEDAEATGATIDALKSLGIRLSADDFGTGYSSLAYLRQYPFDEVKVDRSFVDGLGRAGDDEVIVGAVLSMANALSLSTVAEGVETVKQHEILLSLGAHSAQGWLFSAALPASMATAHLRGVPTQRAVEPAAESTSAQPVR